MTSLAQLTRPIGLDEVDLETRSTGKNERGPIENQELQEQRDMTVRPSDNEARS
jgi:hypothetical protein